MRLTSNAQKRVDIRTTPPIASGTGSKINTSLKRVMIRKPASPRSNP